MYKLNPSNEWYKKASEEEDEFPDVGVGTMTRNECGFEDYGGPEFPPKKNKEKFMKILLLEDDMNRVVQFERRVKELNERNQNQSELVHVETANECIKLLENSTEENEFALILLDHDLGGEIYVSTDNKNTGSEVARWINKNPEKIYGASVITHTFNPDGARNIKGLINGCVYVPAVWLKDKFHTHIQVN